MAGLVLVGLASLALIAYAIADLYDHQAQTDRQLCVIVQAEWDQIQRLGLQADLLIPPDPPPCPAP